MNVKSIIWALLLTAQYCLGQSVNDEIKSLIEAEKKFSHDSEIINTKQAFLNAFDEMGVIFRNGSPVNAIDAWSEQELGNELLTWTPIFADIAMDGTLGYTTGPFEFWRSRSDSVPSGFGYYSSVWHRTQMGDWKVLVDLGVGFREAPQNTPELSYGKVKSASPYIEPSQVKINILQMDDNYNLRLNKTGESLDSGYLFEKFRIHRPFEFPKLNTTELSELDETNKSFYFEQMGGGAASSGDLAYAFGNVRVKLTSNGEERIIRANYLRIWKSNDKNEWKIALDVIGVG